MSKAQPAAKTTRSAKAKTATTKVKSTKAKAPASKTKKSTTVKATAKKAVAKKAATKKSAAKKSEALEDEVTIDRRLKATRREESEVKASAAKAKSTKAKAAEAKADVTDADEAKVDAAPVLERREKVTRRRQIDPTTCERDYNGAEVEFMNALDLYKRSSGRMFPTCSEVLEVIIDLGYSKLSPAELAARQALLPAINLEDSLEAEANEALEESFEYNSDLDDSEVLETV